MSRSINYTCGKFCVICNTIIQFVYATFWNRNDAGLAAAELALAVEKHVLESGSIDNVGTVGEQHILHPFMFET